MRPFAALERFFERIFERPSARLVHTRLQPIQLQRRVERAMENGRLSASDRIVVPNRYVVRLAPTDLRAFGDFADSLELELADAALRFARAHRYAVSDRPAVRLLADPAVDEADVRVDATFSDAPLAPPPPPAAEPVAIPIVRQPPVPEPVPAGIRADAHPRATAETPEAAPPDPALLLQADPPVPTARPPRWLDADQPIPEPPPVAVPARRGTPAGLDRLDPTRTMIFEVPTVDAPLVVLREVGPDGSQRQLTLDGGPVTIGRAMDNNLVLQDSRVSRYHGRLAARAGALVYRDLGSTNGSRVNGVDIDEVVLGAGDRIELGDTVLVVESVAAG
jgi:hypothetical protein